VGKLVITFRTPSRVVACVRVSTDEQAISGLGLQAQEAAIRHGAELRGYAVVAMFADLGVSGSVAAEARPGLTAALSAVRAGAGTLMVAIDRLSRSISILDSPASWSPANETAPTIWKNMRATAVEVGTAARRSVAACPLLQRKRMIDVLAAHDLDALDGEGELPGASPRFVGRSGLGGTPERPGPLRSRSGVTQTEPRHARCIDHLVGRRDRDGDRRPEVVGFVGRGHDH
jgi:Resolvase, N terminal domain